MMKSYHILIIGALAACSTAPEANEATEEIIEPVVEEAAPDGPVIAEEGNKLVVSQAPASVAFDDARLSLEMTEGLEGDKMHFHFGIENYELGVQTTDAPDRGCANSAKGQHIHYIMNNAPYKAHYNADFEEEVPEGRNVLLAFLSRSYHESIKSESAAVVTEVYQGDSTMGPEMKINEDPILFYSRPKGSYKSSDGDRMLLDFYLKNVELSPEGFKVRATIDGETFVLTEWSPYFIEGLEVGTHQVRLELIDADNMIVPGEFNDSGLREFTITAD